MHPLHPIPLYNTLLKKDFKRSFLGLEKNSSGAASSMKCPSSMNMTLVATSLATVSYTHLDVYKRQPKKKEVYPLITSAYG